MSKDELLTQIFNSFDEKIAKVNEMYANAKWDYMNASMYSNAIGAKASSILEEYIPKAIDDGIITADESKAIIGSVMKKSSNLCSEAALKAQELLNEEQKIKLQAKQADINDVNSRILNLTKKYAEYEDHKDGDWLLKKPVQANFTKSVIADTLKQNCKLHSRAGIKAYIKREGSGCCDFCKGLVGQYEIGKAPKDIWAFHKGCTCSIEYVTPYVSERISFSTNENGKLTKITEKINNNSFIKEDKSSKIQSNPVIEAINNGSVSKVINPIKQGRHILGDPNYIEGRSYIYGTVEDAQNIVDKLSGKGEPVYTRSGEWNNKEIVVSNKPIGVNISIDGKDKTETNIATIHYSKTGSHIVPKIKNE